MTAACFLHWWLLRLDWLAFSAWLRANASHTPTLCRRLSPPGKYWRENEKPHLRAVRGRSQAGKSKDKNPSKWKGRGYNKATLLRKSLTDNGGERGIRTPDTPLERITV